MDINFHINVYDGPLEFLYDLIKKEKIDIYDVPIFEITTQFISYIESVKRLDLEIASEFILMAAELTEIKSRYLLYTRDEEECEEDPRLGLTQKLLAYKKFKLACEYLREKSDGRGECFTRKKEEILAEEEFDLSMVTLETIIGSISNVLSYERPKKQDIMRKTYKRKKFSIEEKAKIMIEKISSGDEIPLSSFIYTLEAEEKIVTFLCALELVRKGRALAYQAGFSMPIFIKGVGECGQ